MSELDRIKRNVAKMAAQNAPIEDIDGYIASEGFSLDEVRNHRVSAPKQQGWMEWGKELIQGKQDPKFTGLGRIYDELPTDTGDEYRRTRASVDAAQVLGASDDQLADIYKANLGGKFVSVERDANGYPVITYRDRDGAEKIGYVNIPGLEAEDFARGIKGALPYAVSGGAAGVAGRGLGLLANSALQGTAGTLTSVLGDVAQAPLGSEQGIEADKALATGAFSTAGPAVGKAVGNTVSYVGQKTGIDKGLKEFRKGAVNKITEAMEADKIGPMEYARSAADLGPEGMLADMGPNLRLDAARLARVPGENREIVVNALNRRAEGATERIGKSVDDALGPAINLPKYVEEMSANYQRLAKPYYERLAASHIPITPELRPILQRAKAAGAIGRAQKLMAQEGIEPRFLQSLADDPMTPMTGVKRQVSERVPNGIEFDYIKRSIDDLARDSAPGSNEQRILSNLARDLRSTVDQILSPGNPTQSPWYQGRAIAGQGLEGKEAAELGGKVFTQKRDPFQVEAELDDLSILGQDLYKAGARNDVRGVMGRAASNYGPKGDTAARRTFNSEFNRENLEKIAGPQEAKNLTRRIEAETEFARTNDLAQQNSVTSTIEAAKGRYPGPQDRDYASELGKKGPVGATFEVGIRFINAVLGGAVNKRKERIAADAARMLVAQGAPRERIAQALLQTVKNRGASAEKARAIERVIRSIAIGAEGPLGSAAAND